MKRKYQRWDQEEDAFLKKTLEDEQSIEMVAKRMGRTVKSIEQRCHKLGWPSSPKKHQSRLPSIGRPIQREIKATRNQLDKDIKMLRHLMDPRTIPIALDLMEEVAKNKTDFDPYMLRLDRLIHQLIEIQAQQQKAA